jgi:transcriptional regulator with XRE-family HTH domain
MRPDMLREWRLKNGYTQVTLAQVLRISSNTIARWERGERKIPVFLGITLEALECKQKEAKKGKGTKKTKKESD